MALPQSVSSASDLRSFSERAQWSALEREGIERRDRGDGVAASTPGHAWRGGDRVQGICTVCAARRNFRLPPAYVPGTPLREHARCDSCMSNSRQRAVAYFMNELVGPRSRVYLTEQLSRFYVHWKKRLPALLGSEFYRSPRQRAHGALWLMRHGRLPALRREDVTALSFSSKKFDVVVSMDVLEHIPDHRRALTEFARVLKPGGVLLLTVPIDLHSDRSETLATIDAHGNIHHSAPPEYHGDPIAGGILCFHRFGWDLLKEMRKSGFTEAQLVRIRSETHALPEPQWVVRAVSR